MSIQWIQNEENDPDQNDLFSLHVPPKVEINGKNYRNMSHEFPQESIVKVREVFARLNVPRVVSPPVVYISRFEDEKNDSMFHLIPC